MNSSLQPAAPWNVYSQFAIEHVAVARDKNAAWPIWHCNESGYRNDWNSQAKHTRSTVLKSIIIEIGFTNVRLSGRKLRKKCLSCFKSQWCRRHTICTLNLFFKSNSHLPLPLCLHECDFILFSSVFPKHARCDMEVVFFWTLSTVFMIIYHFSRNFTRQERLC